MTTRTDNPAEIGLHVFEKAGLGKAPFRCVGFYEAVWQAYPGAPIQPGTCCDYCGTGITQAFKVRGADGKVFKVGCDCVLRTGDAGLIKSYKAHPEVRAANRAKAKAKDARNVEAWTALIADPANAAKLNAYKIEDSKGRLRNWLDYATFAWQACGAAGRARYLKTARLILADKL